MKNIKIVEVPSELGAGTRGASLGIDSIKIAALDFMSNFFTNFASVKVEHNNNLLYEPINERTSEAVRDTLKGGFTPVVISGDHSNAIGTIAGIKMAKPKSKLGVIWIDAHADLHTPYTTPSGNMHGMPLAASLAVDNNDSNSHTPDEKTIEQWNSLKNLGKICPKIDADDIVFISLRDFEKEEKRIIDKLGIKVITTAELRRKGPENIVRSVLRYLSDCTDIYVSFDVDSLDSSISKGTGTPVNNGLKEREAEDLVSKFMQNRKICCLEVTEINPTLDKENLMSEIAFNILQRSVNILMLN
jgi:arginase